MIEQSIAFLVLFACLATAALVGIGFELARIRKVIERLGGQLEERDKDRLVRQ